MLKILAEDKFDELSVQRYLKYKYDTKHGMHFGYIGECNCLSVKNIRSYCKISRYRIIIVHS